MALHEALMFSNLNATYKRQRSRIIEALVDENTERLFGSHVQINVLKRVSSCNTKIQRLRTKIPINTFNTR